jgi:tetratricopeptide (TPR) repeat protein
MRAFVFTDRALDRQAGRFVWLSINTEKEKNAGFLERYPIEAYPTLLVIDPTKERAVLRWIGGASLRQIERLLDDAETTLRGGKGTDAALAKADRLLGAGNMANAAAAYRDLLAGAPALWPPRERVLESLLSALESSGAFRECVETARAGMPKERTLHFATVASAGLGCGLSLEGPPQAAAVAEFEPAVRSALGEPRIEMAADDRSGLYGSLAEARKQLGDETGAKTIATDWIAFLEEEAARAPSAEARAVFDPLRVSAAIALGQPARAIPALEQSQKDFPHDYNPPARLAYVLKEAGRYNEALASADRALKLVYGPRKLRVYSIRADILEKKGDAKSARATIEEAIACAKGLPGAQRPPHSLEGLEKRLAGMGPR